MEEKKCPCLGSYLDKLTQPAILTQLARRNMQGSALLAALTEQGQTLDPSGFYRTLKKMEAAGNIASTWKLNPDEKPVRIYYITDAGCACLQNWQRTLTAYRENIDALLREMRQAFASG